MTTSKMPLKQFDFTDKDTRLIKYKNRVYKVKLQYKIPNSANDDVFPFGQKDYIHSELETAIRTVLAMQGDVHPFRTDHLIIYPERKYWNTASLLKFFDHGQELTGDPHMINLLIEVIPEETRPKESVKRGKQAESQSEEDESQEAGPSQGKASRQERVKTRSQLRQTPSRSNQVTDSESASDVNSMSAPEHPNFNSPPRKHRRYVLRKRATSHPPSRRQPKRSAKWDFTNDEQHSNKRYIIDDSSDITDNLVLEGETGIHTPYQANPSSMQPHVAATASNMSLPAHPQGGVILSEMLSPDEIDQQQFEEHMRLQRLAGPAKHPPIEPPRSAIKKIIDVAMTPVKKLFSYK